MIKNSLAEGCLSNSFFFFVVFFLSFPLSFPFVCIFIHYIACMFCFLSYSLSPCLVEASRVVNFDT